MSPGWVEDEELDGTYVFEPTTSLSDKSCQLAVQMVTVSNRLLDLYVEHRGAGPALELARGHAVVELRQIGTTKVRAPHCGTKACLAIYQSAHSAPLDRYDGARARYHTTYGWDEKEGSLLCFT